MIALFFAIALALIWFTLLPFDLEWSWVFLLLPSAALGVWGLWQIGSALDRMLNAEAYIEKLRKPSESSGN